MPKFDHEAELWFRESELLEQLDFDLRKVLYLSYTDEVAERLRDIVRESFGYFVTLRFGKCELVEAQDFDIPVIPPESEYPKIGWELRGLSTTGTEQVVAFKKRMHQHIQVGIQ